VVSRDASAERDEFGDKLLSLSKQLLRAWSELKGWHCSPRNDAASALLAISTCGLAIM
jgi:hypothetical protein